MVSLRARMQDANVSEKYEKGGVSAQLQTFFFPFNFKEAVI